MKKAYSGAFARIYDDVMGAVPYNLWYQYIQEIMDYYKKNPGKVLDLACGTGNMSAIFVKNGYQVTGVDASAEMLYIAREKNPSIDFIQADLREFCFPSSYDTAICLFDSLNYILKEEDLKRVFANTFNSLNNDGLFIFDMNTIDRLTNIKPGTTMLSDEEYTCFWEDIIDRKQQRWKVRLKIYFPDDKSYYEEEHLERGYPSAFVQKMLIDSGFKKVDIYSAYTFEKGKDKDNRLYYVAFKQEIKKKNQKNKLLKRVKWRIKGILPCS